MDFKQIIQAEAARAEALVCKYLGFYPGDLALAELNIAAVDDVSADFKRCVQMIQDLAEAAPSAKAARNMVNLVDALADLVQVPRLRQPLMAMWEIEETLSSGGFWFVRHALVILLAFLGIGFVGPEMSGLPLVISYAAVFTGYASLALALTHFKNPVAAFFVGFPIALVGGVGVMVMGSETLMMVALLLASLGMFVKSIVGMAMTRPTSERTINDDVALGREDGNKLFEDELHSYDRFADEENAFLHNHAGFVPYAADE